MTYQSGNMPSNQDGAQKKAPGNEMDPKKNAQSGSGDNQGTNEPKFKGQPGKEGQDNV